MILACSLGARGRHCIHEEGGCSSPKKECGAGVWRAPSGLHMRAVGPGLPMRLEAADPAVVCLRPIDDVEAEHPERRSVCTTSEESQVSGTRAACRERL